jgi:UDP-2,3-diacylglucosamine pyrophosphatase LpxH
VHPHQVNGRERTRIVLGDWYEQGSVLELDALGAPALRTLSFPTPPANTPGGHA